MNKQITAIILAAGQSRRMGEPKMLLPWEGSTVIGRVIATFAEAGIPHIIVVTGAEHIRVTRLVTVLASKYPVRAIHNRNYRTGEMLSSLQCGLSRIGSDADAALFGLGDQPQLKASTVRAVAESFESDGAHIIVPSYQMRRGHPWLADRGLWEEIGSMKKPLTARDFLNRHANEICYVNVDSPSIHEDLDTPEDYRRSTGGD